MSDQGIYITQPATISISETQTQALAERLDRFFADIEFAEHLADEKRGARYGLASIDAKPDPKGLKGQKTGEAA